MKMTELLDAIETLSIEDLQDLIEYAQLTLLQRLQADA